MTVSKRIAQAVGLSVALILVLCRPQMATAAIKDFHFTPNAIHVTESFHGVSIAFSGEIPKGDDALVEITGPTHDMRLLKKGRRGGLWMSVGEVEVSGAPSVYLMASTDPNVRKGAADKSEIGYGALAKQVEFSGAVSSDKGSDLFTELTKLKESQGRYGIFPGALHVTPAAAGRSKFEGSLRLPSNVAPGDYKVTLSVLDKGQLVQRQSAPLRVDMKGITAFLAGLATKHGALYGVLAVVIALIIGFAMGFVFKSKGAH